MTGPQVKALLKACGLTAKQAGERIGRGENMMSTYATKGCDLSTAMALAAMAANLPVWTNENEPAFAAVRSLVPALKLDGPN